MTATATRDRLPSLTGLRFVAALLVVLYHLTRQVGPIPGITALVNYGRSGVTFFFVLSGFVLAWTYADTHVPLRVFFRRRFARIWPLHAVTTALSVAVSLAIGTAVNLKLATFSLLLVHAWSVATAHGGNPAAWSLSDEAWFYLTFPAVLTGMIACAGRYRRLAAAAFAGSLLVCLASSRIDDATVRAWFVDYFPPVRWLQFLMGVAVGLAVRRGWRSPIPLWLAALLVGAWHVALVPWSHLVPPAAWDGAFSGSELFSGPLFALLIVAAATNDLTGRTGALGGDVMRRLGHWSYAWYLVHEIGIRLYLGWFRHQPAGLRVPGVWLVLGATTLAVAGALYTCVEHPAERWLRQSTHRGGGRQGRTVPPSCGRNRSKE